MIERILNDLDGGKVLDVATHEGHFVQILAENLKSYMEIVGIDISEKDVKTAQNNLTQENIRFWVMDAEHLEFEDATFDTVTISASLHHLANIPRVLDEMLRALKPGGHFILIEMHENGQTDAERTSISLHQWVAEVDTALGFLHHKTLTRQEFVNYVTGLELSHVEYYDFRDEDSDPKEKTRIEQLESLIERTIRRAGVTSFYAEFKKRGEALLQQLYKSGAQREPVLIIVGEK